MLQDEINNNGLGCIPHTKNFSFASGTTYGCGGIAKAAFFPRTEEEACALFSYVLNAGKKHCILGCGSDVLAQDGFFDGWVISTSSLCGISVNKSGGGASIESGGGVKISSLLEACKREGLSGLEFAAGIPASIGGLVYMNGGAAGKSISEIVSSVRIFDGKIRILSREECNFTYKHSTMRDIKCLILSVKLTLTRENPSNVAQNIKNRLRERTKLPCGRSCGCVFENYCGVSAGKIIENAGLKGACVGGAFVSEKHANFIINRGKKASDVYALIKYVKEEVYKKFGITLKEEVCYIGDFE